MNVTYCVDVGSVVGANFAWARLTDDIRGPDSEHELGGSHAVIELRERLRADLSDARALGLDRLRESAVRAPA